MSADRNLRILAAKLIARGICASSGPKPSCICNGMITHCHAVQLYGDYAVYALLALERAGITLRQGRIEHDPKATPDDHSLDSLELSQPLEG